MSRDDAKNRVQQATDLIELIGEQLPLQARGKEFVGVCPFHDDSKPSLMANPVKQIYKCFACGAGGDVFSFVMNYHKMSFREALVHLAERARIELPRWSGAASVKADSDERQLIFSANQAAMKYFQRMLQHPTVGQPARDYLAERGINQAMIDAFHIGYAPDEWSSLTDQLRAKQADLPVYEKAHLIAARRSGDGHYDRFRHRLMFPIVDPLKRPIAFGGRILANSQRQDESDAKYLNSAETPVFNKSKTLFGMHLAQKPIIDAHVAIVVEGYTDVIACHQHGIANVVATLGTALTPDHARQLGRYCDKVILLFDPDEAGQRAADRAVATFFNEPIDVHIAMSPDQLDPADLLAEPDGLARWQQMLSTTTDAIQFQLNRLKGNFDQADTLTGRQRLIEAYVQELVQLGFMKLPPARRGLIEGQIADLLRVDIPTVNQIFQAAPRPRNPRPPRNPRNNPRPLNSQNQTPQTPNISPQGATGSATAPSSDFSPPINMGDELPDEFSDYLADVPLAPGTPPATPPGTSPGTSPEMSNGTAAAQTPTLNYGKPVTANDIAGYHIIGCLLESPDLFHLQLSDGRPLSESIGTADFAHTGLQKLYHNLYEWLCDQSTLSTADLRDMLDGDEQLLTLAIDAMTTVQQIKTIALSDQLQANARTLTDRHISESYHQEKWDIQQTDDDSIDEQTQAHKLNLDRIRATPSARRFPRLN